MVSSSRVRPFPALLRLLAWSAALFWPAIHGLAADPAAPVQLPAFGVAESVLNVPVRIEYERTAFGPLVHKVYVGTLRPSSIAEKAGLKEDMEIVAIQGTKVLNLSQVRIQELLSQPVKEAVVLLVRRSWLHAPVEIRLPAPAEPAEQG